jgi:hypothetical protein
MGSQKAKTTQQQTATTTPTLPGYLGSGIENFYTGVGNLAQNPASAITPANSNQTAAWSGAANLPSGSSVLSPATGLLGNAASLIGGVQPVQTATAAMPQGYNPAMVQNQGYPTLATAGVSQAQAPGLPTVGQAGVAQSGMPNLPTAGQAGVALGSVAPPPSVALASAPGDLAAPGKLDTKFLDGYSAGGYGGANMLDYMSSFQSPYLKDVVDATMADLKSQQGQEKAALARQGAQNNAFGGSRWGIAQAELADRQGRTLASTLGGLRDQSWTRALDASGTQAGLKNAAGIASANNATQMASTKAGLEMQGKLAEYESNNDWKKTLFGAGLDLSKFNAGEQNQWGQSLFDALNQMSQSNATAINQGNQFNTGQANQFGLAGYNGAIDNAQFNTSQANQGNQFNTGQANDMAATGYTTGANLAQFNAGQANQTGQFNAGEANNAAATQYTTNNSNAQTNTNSLNAMLSQLFGAQNQTSQFNTGQTNDGNQFNANLALGQGQALGGLGASLGGMLAQGNQIDQNNLATQGAAGTQQYNYDNQYSQANLLAMINQLGGFSGLAGNTIGQTVNSSGTGTSAQSGGFLNSLLGAAGQLGSSAITASDRRVKRDIALVARERDGLGRYNYRYLWDDDAEPLRRGVMADEVAAFRPWALGPVVEGISTVDYSMLEAA